MSRESPYGEVRIQITSPVEDTAQFADSSPTGQNFVTPRGQATEDNEEKQHVSFEKEEKDKKKQRKSVDDAKSKRKETTTSFTNFFHRLTRSDKEEKHKSTTSITEEDKLLDRPNQLVLPEVADGNWTELKTLGTDQFRTALDMGNETGMPVYEWKPDSLEEHLVTESVPPINNLIGMNFERPEKEDIERSLLSMLEEFRSGNMRSFTDEQIAAMRTAKQMHEEVTNMHIALYALHSDPSDNDIESQLGAIMLGQTKSEFNSIEQMITTVNGLQMDKAEAAVLVADIARKNKELLEQKPNETDQILAHINPGYSSALIIACIKAILDVGLAKKQDQNVDRATDLFITFLQSETCVKEHIRHIPDLYLPLARECVFHCLVKRADPFFAYDFGKAAIQAFINEEENCLTSLHSAVLAAAIKIGDFEEAKKYVYTPILDVVSELNPVHETIDITSKRSRCSAPPYFDSKYMLSYFFYCGLVVGKLGDYKKSLQFMEMCIGVPGSVASQVQMDALKKYYVLSLIVNGGVLMPSNRSPSLMRVLKAKGRLDAYTALVEAVTENNDKSKAVLQVLETKKTHFDQDNNWGLCQILVETLRKKAVLNVVKTYSSIRLADLAHRSHCSEEEVVPFLKDLEEQGEIQTEIDLHKGIVKLAVTQKAVAHNVLLNKIEYLQNVRKEVDRLEVAAQKNPSHIIRTLRGIAGQIAMMDDEGLSESACPMDA